MGCTQSVPKEPRAPLEPVPDLEAVKKMVAEAISGEPLLTSKDSNMLDMEKAVHLVLKQTGTHSNGKTFEISPFDAAEANKDDLLIEPALLFGGQVVRRMLQDLVVMRRNKRIDEEQTPICFAVKDAPVGINFFKILTTKPVREGQAPSIFKGPDKLELYTYASIEFDYDTKVCSIRIVGQGKNDPPLYTCQQSNASTWVLKKNKQGIIAVITKTKGLMPKFTAWDLTISAGVDQAFVCCMANIIDWFVITLKKQFISYYK